MKWVFVIAFTVLISIAGPASACRWIGNHRALIHSTVSVPLPPDAIVLEVEFDAEEVARLYDEGLRARVRHVVSGEFDGAVVVIKAEARSSCHSPLENGSSGLVVGFLTEQGTLSPVLVQHHTGFQLQPGDAIAPFSLGL